MSQQTLLAIPSFGMLAERELGVRLPLTVMESQKGFYIGTTDEEGPVSRESAEYWAEEADAVAALESTGTEVQSWTQRTES